MATLTPRSVSRCLRQAGFRKAGRRGPGFSVRWHENKRAVVVTHGLVLGEGAFAAATAMVTRYRLALDRKGWDVRQVEDTAIVTGGRD